MPVPVLHTERLILRPLVAEDAPAIVAGLSDWEVTRWLTGVPFPYAQTDALAFIHVLSQADDELHWALDAGLGLVGVMSLHPELGFWLGRDLHGRGLVTEAAKVLLDWHFGQRDADVVSGYHLGNAASARVQVKLGFLDTHLERDVETARGERVTIQRTCLTMAGHRAATAA